MLAAYKGIYRLLQILGRDGRVECSVLNRLKLHGAIAGVRCSLRKI